MHLSASQRRWFVLAALWLALLVLGIGGFLQQADARGESVSWPDTLYDTMQLALLEYSDGGDLNWRLQIARFVAPILSLSTLLLAAWVVLRDQLGALRLRTYRHHAVVCGLGDTGTRLALALTGAGERVVAIERDPSVDGVSTVKAHRIIVVTGDATDELTQRTARVSHAARLVVVGRDDARNIETVGVATRIERPPAALSLRCSVQLSDAELCRLLQELSFGGDSDIAIDFFNVEERAARAWIAEFPPFGSGHGRPHFVVAGLGRLGRALVVAAAQRWHESGDGQPLRITLVDADASGRYEGLRFQHPALESALEVELLDLDLTSPTTDAVAEARALLSRDDISGVAVAFADEQLSISTALLLHEMMASEGRVVARIRTESGFGALLRSEGATLAYPRLAFFPVLDRTCTVAALDGGAREQLARALHDDYLARAAPGSPLARPWDLLSDEERESSRRAADAMSTAFGERGLELVPLRHWGAPALELSDADVEWLARREHERWRDERERAGWTYGEERDDDARRHPLLVDWDGLPGDVQETNRVAARNLPVLLARVGFELVRR